MQKNEKICSNTIGLFVNWDEKVWAKLKTLLSYLHPVRGKHLKHLPSVRGGWLFLVLCCRFLTISWTYLCLRFLTEN